MSTHFTSRETTNRYTKGTANNSKGKPKNCKTRSTRKRSTRRSSISNTWKSSRRRITSPTNLEQPKSSIVNSSGGNRKSTKEYKKRKRLRRKKKFKESLFSPSSTKDPKNFSKRQSGNQFTKESRNLQNQSSNSIHLNQKLTKRSPSLDDIFCS